jgi:hypothetical protein
VDHRREAHEDGGPFAGLLEELGARVLGDGLVADFAVRLEKTVRARAARVDDAFGDALAVEVGDLFEELVVLQRRRPRLPTVRTFWLSWIGWPCRVVMVFRCSPSAMRPSVALPAPSIAVPWVSPLPFSLRLLFAPLVPVFLAWSLMEIPLFLSSEAPPASRRACCCYRE